MRVAHLLMAASVAVCQMAVSAEVPNQLTDLEVEGPDVLCSHMTAAFTCTASWSNLVDSVDVTREATWSVIGGDGLVRIGETNGVLTLDEAGINDLNDLVQVQILVKYGGVVELRELEIIPTESDELQSLDILGADALGSHMTAQPYYCTAKWFSADEEVVDPSNTNLVWTFADGSTIIPGVAALSNGGLLTPDPKLSAETNVLLRAVYRGNEEAAGEYEVTLTPEQELEPDELSIEGPDEVPSGEEAAYEAILRWSNWAEETLTGDERLTWNVFSTNGAPHAEIDGTGVLTANSGLTVTGTVFVCASFTQGGKTVATTNEVTIVPAPTLKGVAIYGPACVVATEGATAQFALRGIWSNGEVRDCTPDAEWSVEPGEEYASVVGGALKVPAAVEDEQAVTVKAVYEGDEATAQIVLIPKSALRLTGLSVFGPGEVYYREGVAVRYSCIGAYSDYTYDDCTTNVTWSLSPAEGFSFAEVDSKTGVLRLNARPQMETNVWLVAEHKDGVVTSNSVSIFMPSIEIVGAEELGIQESALYRCAEVRSAMTSVLLKNPVSPVAWATDSPGLARLDEHEGQATLVPNRRAQIDLEAGAELVLTVAYGGMTNELAVTILPGTNPLANPDVPAMVVTGFDDSAFAAAAAAKKIVAFAMRMDMEEGAEPPTGRAVLFARIEGTYNAKKGTLTAKAIPAGGKPVQFAAGNLAVGGGVATGVLTGKKDPEARLDILLTPEQVGGTLTAGGETYEVRGGWDVFANKKDAAARAALGDFAGVCNVALPVMAKADAEESEGLDACPPAGGYLSVNVNAKSGKAKVAGVLGDGTKVTANVPVCTLGGVKEAETNCVCLPIVIPLNSNQGSFTGVLWLHRQGKAGREISADFNTACCAWYAHWHNAGKKFKESDDHPYAFPCEYEAWIGGIGGKFDPAAIPAGLVVTNLEDDIAGPPEYYVKSRDDYDTLDVQDSAYPFGLEFAYDASKGKLKPDGWNSTKPKKFKDDGDAWYEYAGATDSGLKLSLNKKTGVLTGGFKLWYEGTVGESDKLMLKSLSPKVFGAWVPGLGGYLFGVVKESNPDLKSYALKRCLPFALVRRP